WLIRAALRRPISVIVIVVALALTAILAVQRTRVDIFPDLNLPVIYVAQPYGGMSPAQMEGYVSYYYEYHFLYINGVEKVEAKSIQGASLLRITFHPGTNMSNALAETISYVNRARAFMPPGTVSPFVIRYDAGTLPVGYLVFNSPSRTLGEIQDLALNRVRPVFATLPGVSSPPPFGGNQRTIVISVDPDKLHAYGLSPQSVVQALTSGNSIEPAGTANIGNVQALVTTDSTVQTIDQLLEIPIHPGSGDAVYLRDVASVTDSSDILAGYALLNGHRTVYIPVTKRPDASTLTVVDEVRQSIPRFQSLVPEDIKISYEFDQSQYVRDALSSVLREGLLGALLTGLTLLLFLRDWRSSLIVVITIPFALLIAVVALWAAGQTINIMTLGGLALAVGVLVDEGTVLLENIHVHLAAGKAKPRAIVDASREVAIPRLLAMLAVLAVFLPSFFMVGPARALFVPLSLAVGFSMAASYLLSSSLVPVLSNWLLKAEEGGAAKEQRLARFRQRFLGVLDRLMAAPALLLAAYVAIAALVLLLIAPRLRREIFPASAANQFRLRFDAPDGTRVPVTEQMARRVLDIVGRDAGPGNLEISISYVGAQGSSYPINTVFLWTSGPHEAVMNIALRPGAPLNLRDFEEKLRHDLPQQFPGAHFSFDPGDLVSQTLNFGTPSVIEVDAMGPQYNDVLGYSTRLNAELAKISELRDLGVEQPLHYPTVDVRVNRVMAGQLGATADQVGQAVVSATASSRFVAPNYWRDPRSGVSYQVQVQVPQPEMTSLQDIATIPVASSTGAHPLLSEVASVRSGAVPGELDRLNGQWMVGLSANLARNDLGRAGRDIESAIRRAGTPPRGVSVQVRGQVTVMNQIFSNLSIGLGVAILVILLLLAANFESVRLSLIVLSTAPAVLAGSILMLLVTGTSINLESFMGTIMAIGVAVANAILLVTFAEQNRRNGANSHDAARNAASERLRPVLMTSLAMITGMIPMALAIGRGSEETAPLGRAVIGGLAAATLATLLVLPTIFSLVQRRASVISPSLDPDDPHSRYASPEVAS
ncbi:MAG TPA: efflux RND transporter permease subunit, partial [Terriglobales bacterium]|nr:efflux RND transporter permease subunit [Terriglobales bacterium]